MQIIFSFWSFEISRDSLRNQKKSLSVWIPFPTNVLYIWPRLHYYSQNVCDALSYLLNNIYIRFGIKLYRQIVEIPMGTNCAPLVADFLYCYEIDFMDSLNHDNKADVIEAFNSTSTLNIDNPYFKGMVNQIYPPELQLNKANTTDTEAPFLDLHLSIANGFVSSKIYDKRDDFDFSVFAWMVTFRAVHLMVYTFRNLLGLLEPAIVLRTSTREINI